MSIDHRKTVAHQPSYVWSFHPVATDTPFKVCRCKDPDTGRPLRNKCPKLRRANRSWSLTHGQWAYQLELPPTADGKRRQLRPTTGFENRDAAQDEIDQVRRLLDLAGKDPTRLIQGPRRATGDLPDLDTVRFRLKTDTALGGIPTLAQYLTGWVNDIEIDEN